MIKSVFYKDLQPLQLLEKVRKCPVAFLPMGTLEWHGRHMPLGTDMMIPEKVFSEVANQFGGVVLPPLFLAPDIHQKRNGKEYAGMEICGFEENKPNELFGNAYYISEKLFFQILESIVKNLKKNGFNYLIAHGHGPSMHGFEKCKEKFRKKYGITCYTLFDLGFVEERGIQTDHAATNETSLIMAINNNLVDIENINQDPTPVAIWGEDPREKASVEFGNNLLRTNVEKILDSLEKKITKSTVEKGRITLSFSNIKNLIKK